ncbi:putative uncharacterized protein [Parachlamydia acanthamoebae UV-7]|uniref:Uncharacterized protein n=2 Tax=Parachlamydia acanthamoebae TaxID=83552 RepID=F8KUT2_PARAV|nr:hypothetical protein [Parachlamydia acanthamoebae]KIA76573.1 hypothetical protein DB43_AB00380 [Parachlamydia acanthamoebae]CCB84997.1 putative uncharacterized protein [Parachlamydia acanthamoebae UV-7]
MNCSLSTYQLCQKSVPGIAGSASQKKDEAKETKKPYFREWVADGVILTIAQDGDRLNYELFDKISYNLSRGRIPTLPGTPIEKTIRDLTKSEPIINDEKQPEFGQVRAKWILENGELSLLHLKNDLIWQLFEKSTQKNSRMPFDINLLQLMCAESKSNQSSHEAFKKEWQKLNTDSPDEIVRFLKKNAQVKASYSYNTEPNHHADEKK